MVDERAPALARRLTAHARVLRRARIFARLREGWAYDEIARDEGLTAERIRQIVREALEKRLLDEETDHAKLQLARLQPAMRIAAEAVADGHVEAIAPLIKVLDRLDRYQIFKPALCRDFVRCLRLHRRRPRFKKLADPRGRRGGSIVP